MAIFEVEEVLTQMTLEEKAQMCSGCDFWHTQDIERLGIPAIMMCDGPNGLRKQLGEGDHLGIHESIETICYPTASCIASSFDEELAGELGAVLGEECQAEQVGMLLGPGINIKRSPVCGRNFEYFSEDPYLAGKMAAAYIRGLQDKGVAACVKHFAANNQETRRTSGSSQMSQRTLHEIYLPAFEMAVKEGHARGVMCAYNAINGTFCAENKTLLTDILRSEWGFEGIVVTDWGAVKNRVKGLEAGVDLEMPGSRQGKQEKIVKAVKSGELPEELLDQAVRNVLRFVRDTVHGQKENAAFNREVAHEISAKFARESAVLLKNAGALPLDSGEKIAFIGEFAENVRYQGAGCSHIQVSHPMSVLECVNYKTITEWEREVPESGICYAKGYCAEEDETDEELLAEAVRAAKETDTAVIFAGLPESREIEGSDRETMVLPENQNRLIREIAKVQPHTVVVLHGGAPMELPWLSEVDAVLCMYLGGDRVGEAACDLLFGRHNPSGKLAETWPLKLEDNPSWLNFPGEDGIVKYQEEVFVGYRYYDKKKMEVCFPFGHGLSYTNFSYSDITLDKDRISCDELLTVSCRVRNTGTMYGKEAVQIYVLDLDSSVRRPVRELKGFYKIGLQPGETKEVFFKLDKRAFAYYEEKVMNWHVESGRFRIEIGASSRDIRLSGEVQVESADEIPVFYTRLSAVAELMKTAVGREIFSELTARLASRKSNEANQETDAAMGSGSAKARQTMMMEMPLEAFVTYGVIREAELDGVIERLNL